MFAYANIIPFCFLLFGGVSFLMAVMSLFAVYSA